MSLEDRFSKYTAETGVFLNGKKVEPMQPFGAQPGGSFADPFVTPPQRTYPVVRDSPDPKGMPVFNRHIEGVGKSFGKYVQDDRANTPRVAGLRDLSQAKEFAKTLTAEEREQFAPLMQRYATQAGVKMIDAVAASKGSQAAQRTAANIAANPDKVLGVKAMKEFDDLASDIATREVFGKQNTRLAQFTTENLRRTGSRSGLLNTAAMKRLDKEYRVAKQQALEQIKDQLTTQATVRGAELAYEAAKVTAAGGAMGAQYKAQGDYWSAIQQGQIELGKAGIAAKAQLDVAQMQAIEQSYALRRDAEARREAGALANLAKRNGLQLQILGQDQMVNGQRSPFYAMYDDVKRDNPFLEKHIDEGLEKIVISGASPEKQEQMALTLFAENIPNFADWKVKGSKRG